MIKDLTRNYVKGISWNLALLMSLTNTGTTIIYTDEASGKLLKELSDERILTISESQYPLHGDSRTTRLAFGRNLLLQKARDLVTVRKEDPSRAYLAVIDLDDVSAGKFNEKVLRSAMKASTEWDAVSFNRHRGGYYDIWALRYPPYDLNLWSQDDAWGLLRNITRDIELRLQDSKQKFYPVLSAFNGVAIYKMNFTIGCSYDGVPMGKGINEVKDVKGVDDCEHVSFHRCIINRNGARVTIDKDAIS
jgi:hypothetical protein